MTAQSQVFSFLGAIYKVEGNFATGTFVRDDHQIVEGLTWPLQSIANGPPMIGSILIARAKVDQSGPAKKPSVATMKSRVLTREETLKLDLMTMDQALEWVRSAEIPGV